MDFEEELIREYIDDSREKILGIETLLEQEEYEKITRLGHQLKGSGGSFGFDILSEMGLSLENAGIEHDDTKILALKTQLINTINAL